MNKSNIRFILTLIALVVIAVAGYFWYQQNQIKPEHRQKIVQTVDRGLSEEHRAQLFEQIEEQKLALEQEKAAGQQDISIILQLGNLYYSLGELKTSVEYYDQILKNHPEDAPALENKGQSLYEMGDFQGAEQAWLKALESNQYEVTYLRLADLYREKLTEKEPEIKGLMETAITNLGQQKSFLIILGHWYRDNGYVDEAISHYEIVMQLDPNNQDIAKEITKLREIKTRELQQKD